MAEPRRGEHNEGNTEKVKEGRETREMATKDKKDRHGEGEERGVDREGRREKHTNLEATKRMEGEGEEQKGRRRGNSRMTSMNLPGQVKGAQGPR